VRLEERVHRARNLDALAAVDGFVERIDRYELALARNARSRKHAFDEAAVVGVSVACAAAADQVQAESNRYLRRRNACA